MKKSVMFVVLIGLFLIGMVGEVYGETTHPQEFDIEGSNSIYYWEEDTGGYISISDLIGMCDSDADINGDIYECKNPSEGDSTIVCDSSTKGKVVSEFIEDFGAYGELIYYRCKSKIKTDAVCGSSTYSCDEGDLDKTVGSTYYKDGKVYWTCKGINGGEDIECSGEPTQHEAEVLVVSGDLPSGGWWGVDACKEKSSSNIWEGKFRTVTGDCTFTKSISGSGGCRIYAKETDRAFDDCADGLVSNEYIFDGTTIGKNYKKFEVSSVKGDGDAKCLLNKWKWGFSNSQNSYMCLNGKWMVCGGFYLGGFIRTSEKRYTCTKETRDGIDFYFW